MYIDSSSLSVSFPVFSAQNSAMTNQAYTRILCTFELHLGPSLSQADFPSWQLREWVLYYALGSVFRSTAGWFPPHYARIVFPRSSHLIGLSCQGCVLPAVFLASDQKTPFHKQVKGKDQEWSWRGRLSVVTFVRLQTERAMSRSLTWLN